MKSAQSFLRAARLRLRDRATWSAVSVCVAGLLLCEVNVLAARNYRRWDFSAGARFSPSGASQRLVAGLQTPVEVVVLLPLAHPLRTDIRQMLEAFSALSPRLSARFIDPDRDAAEYLALAKEQESAGQNLADQSGTLEAAFLVRQAGRSWFVPTSELYAVDSEGQRRPRIESALSDAILRVQTSERLTLCFVTGHGEKSLDDGADDGLLELRRSLDARNMEGQRTPLDVPRPDLALRDCDVVALVGPKAPVPPEHQRALLGALDRGAHFLLFLDPIVDANGALAASGLEEITLRFGVHLPRGFVLEQKSEQRLPQGIGEAFLAEVVPHPITSGLSSDDMRLDRRAVLVAAQPLELSAGSSAVPLLTASSEAVILDRLGAEIESGQRKQAAPPLLAAASRISASSGQEVRAVIVGTSNVADSRSFRDAALSGNRTFVEQALAWIASRPLAHAVPDQEQLPAGLALTEESLTDVLSYVLLYMPGTAFFLGVWVLWRRRQTEARARIEPEAERTT